MKAQLEAAKQTALVELKDLGYNSQEMSMFAETTVCPRCGHDFSNEPSGARWIAHFANCKDR